LTQFLIFCNEKRKDNFHFGWKISPRHLLFASLEGFGILRVEFGTRRVNPSRRHFPRPPFCHIQ
jgi:hypothetical protein